MANYTRSKMIISGNIVEIYEFEKNVYFNYSDDRKTGRRKFEVPAFSEEDGGFLGTIESSFDNPRYFLNEEDYNMELDFREDLKEKNQTVCLRRAKQKVMRLSNANRKQLNKFLTLTFREHVTNIDDANKDFTNFIKRVNRYLKKQGEQSLQYIAVIEFTKKGRVHYHLLCNLPYTPAEIIERMWGNGFISIQKRSIGKVDNIGAYITKYMTKSLSDKRLEGRKKYFRSYNLIEPIEERDPTSIQITAQKISHNKVYEKEFSNEHVGNVRYTQYNLNRVTKTK